MNTRVRVIGLPKALKPKKLIQVLGHVLNINMKNVYVNVLPSSSGSRKDALLTFTFPSDAQLAQEKLDNFVYTYNNEIYVLAAKYDYDSRRNNKNRSVSPGSNYKGRFNDRPRQDRRAVRQSVPHKEDNFDNEVQSRMLSMESSDLDRQIEILKKQRLILEEERKLLEEQQKLQEFKMKIQLSGTGENPVSDSAKSSQPDSKVAQKPVMYYKACGVLIRKMNKFINQHSRSENRKALMTRLRSTLSDRIIALVNGQPIYQTQKVLELYRNQYPESEDESLVKEIVQNLDEIVWAEGETLSAELEMEGEKAAKTTDSGTKKSNTKDKGETNRTAEERNKPSAAGSKPAKQIYYFQATKVLLKRMNGVMDLHAEGEKRQALVALLRYRVKDRFVNAIAGRPIYQTYKVLQAYREVYPISEDENFVKALLKEIDDNKWSVEDIKKMTVKWNKKDKGAEKEDGAGNNDTAVEEETVTSAEKEIEDKNDTAKEKETVTSAEEEIKDQTEALTEEVTNSRNTGTVDVQNEDINKDETTKSESSVENKNEEAANEQSVNATPENSKSESIQSAQTENSSMDSKSESNGPSETKNNGMEDESRGVKRRNSTTDDGEAKLAKIWEVGAGDLDIPIDMDGFED